MPRFGNVGSIENIAYDVLIREITEALQGESLMSTKALLDLLIFVINDWSYGYFYGWLIAKGQLPATPTCPASGELIGSFGQSPKRVIYKSVYLSVIQLLLGKLLLSEGISSHAKRYLIDSIVVSIGDEFYYCYFADILAS